MNGHTLKVRKVASKAEQERIRARVQDADMGGGILWSHRFLGRFRFRLNCRVFCKLATTEGEETTFVGTEIGLEMAPQGV